MTDEINRIRRVYVARKRDDADRDYMWHPRNSSSYTYRHIREKALIELLNDNDVNLESANFLDIGCGNGGFVRFIVSLGANPKNVCGVDVLPERVAKARTVCPSETFLHVGDARNMAFADASFDIASQFTVFSSVLAEEFRHSIAREISSTRTTPPQRTTPTRPLPAT